MKNTFVSVLFVFVAVSCFAQKTKFGIKGGLNVANISWNEQGAPKPSNIIGYTIGGLLEIKLSSTLALQPEVLYSTQGSKFDFTVFVDGTLYDTENQFNFKYLNIPIMLKYYASDDFCLEFGPQVGFLTSADLTTKVIGRSVTQNAKNLFTSNDFGLNVGLSYNFSPNVFLQGRYNFGLTNIAKTESGDDSTIKNSVLSFSLGYKFK